MMKKRHQALIGLISILVAWTAPSASQAAAGYNGPSEQELQTYVQAPEAQKAKLLIRLVMSGDHEFAARLLKEVPLQGEFAANRTVFIEGLILKARGDLTGAVGKFRTALASDPKLTLVRSELAKTLVMLDENDSAKHHLELLAADAPDENEAGAVRSFIDQIDARKPYKIGGYVSLAPSTNINTGANAKKIYLPTSFGAFEFTNDDAKKSGLGVAVGLNGGYSRRIGNDWSAVLSGGINANIYGETAANAFSFSESAEMRYLLADGFLSFGLVESYVNAGSVNSDERTNSVSFGPRVAFVKQLGLRNTISGSAVLERREVAKSTEYDGKAALFNAALSHAIDSSFNVTLSGGFEKVMLNAAPASYDAASASLSFYKEMPLGVTVNGSLGYRVSDFKGDHWSIGEARHDKRVTGNLSLTKRDLNVLGFAPVISYSYTRNMSNVILNDYDSHAVDFRLTKDF
jgi:outer membrane protein